MDEQADKLLAGNVLTEHNLLRRTCHVLRTKPIPRCSEQQVTNSIQLSFSGPNISIKQLKNNETDFDFKKKKTLHLIFLFELVTTFQFRLNSGEGEENKGHFSQKSMCVSQRIINAYRMQRQVKHEHNAAINSISVRSSQNAPSVAHQVYIIVTLPHIKQTVLLASPTTAHFTSNIHVSKELRVNE